MLRRRIFSLMLTGVAAIGLACGSDASNLIGAGGSAEGGSSTGGSSTGGSAEGGSGGSAMQPLAITEVTLDQAVQRPVEGDAVPIVGGRDALVRVFYEGGTPGTELEVELTLDGVPEAVQEPLGGGSSQADLDSTFNVVLDGSLLSPGEHSLVVRLLDGGTEEVARYPESGAASFTVDALGIDLELVFVPLDDTEGGNLATVDAALEQSWRDYVFARFPVVEVTTSVGTPLTVDTTLTPNGGGWSQATDALAARRMADGAAPNQFYVGLFETGTTLADWCGGGCITSLSASNIAGYEPANHHVLTISFPELGAQAASWNLTLLHGVGTTGCAYSGQEPAPDYPHSMGSTGGWGYDLVTGELHDPSSSDVASLCSGDIWVSDYTFDKLFAYQQQIAAEL